MFTLYTYDFFLEQRSQTVSLGRKKISLVMISFIIFVSELRGQISMMKPAHEAEWQKQLTCLLRCVTAPKNTFHFSSE